MLSVLLLFSVLLLLPVLLLLAVLLLLLLLAHGQGQVQVVSGVIVRRVQPQGFLVCSDGPLHVLS